MTAAYTPPGRNTVSPYLLVSSARQTLAFLTTVFQANELRRIDGENGAVKHAEVAIGDSVIMLGERQDAAMPASLHIYVRDVDATYHRALQSGATSISEPRDMPYGDRSAGVRDAQGSLWWIGTAKAAT